jgi:hypothetical protein
MRNIDHIVKELRSLADDFDRLSDVETRDDSLFIYGWTPPTWTLDGNASGWLKPNLSWPPPSPGRQASIDAIRASIDECVAIAAMLREAAKLLT